MKPSMTIVALSLALSLAACGGKEERMQSHFEKSHRFYAAADYDKASVEIRNVLQIDPKHAQAHVLAGRIDEARKEYQKALTSYQKALELDPALAEPRLRLARFYLFAGAIDKAQSEVDTLLRANPKDPDARAVLAALQAGKGEAAAAMETAAAVLRDKPGHGDATTLAAGLHISRNEQDAALELLEKGVKADPRNVELHEAYANVAARAGKKELAERELRALVDLAPGKFEPRQALATYLARSDQAEKAEAVLREAVAQDPADHKRAIVLSDFLLARKGPQAAIQELETLVRKNPRAYPLHFRLAALHLSGGRSGEAKKIYEYIAENDDGSHGVEAKVDLARLAVVGGRRDEAAAMLGDILKEGKNNRARVLRARLQIDKKDYIAAIGDLRAVLKDDPASVEALQLLAAAHQLNNEADLGRDALLAAASMYPRNTDLRMLAVEYLIQSGDIEGALKNLDNGIEANPNDPRPFQTKITLLNAKKQDAEISRTLLQFKQAMPNAAAPYFRAGVLHLSRNDFSVGIKELEEALKREPNSAEIQSTLISAYVVQKKFDEAAARAAQMAEANPKDAVPHLLISEVRMAQNKADEAQRSLEKAIEVNPKTALAYVNLSRLHDTRGNRSEAIRVLEQGIETLPVDATLVTALAELHRRKGDVKAAMAVYERVLIGAPDHDVVANNLASLLSELSTDPKDLQRAFELAQRFQESNNPAYRDTLGWIMAKRGDYKGAVPHLERAVALAPQSPLLRYHLGMALYNSGNKEDGLKNLRQALEAKAEFPGIEEAKRIVATG